MCRKGILSSVLKRMLVCLVSTLQEWGRCHHRSPSESKKNYISSFFGLCHLMEIYLAKVGNGQEVVKSGFGGY